MIYLLSPKTSKYKTQHKCVLKHIIKNNTLHYGDWGIMAAEAGTLSSKQIEASRRIISKHIKTIGKMWVKIFPDHAISRKAKDSRMGSGKGRLFKWVYVAYPGNVLFEATQTPLKVIKTVFKLVKSRLPIKIKIIYKNI